MAFQGNTYTRQKGQKEPTGKWTEPNGWPEDLHRKCLDAPATSAVRKPVVSTHYNDSLVIMALSFSEP